MRRFIFASRYKQGSLGLRPRQAGFSLYDLIVTSAVAGFVSISAVGMVSVVQDTRMTAEINELMVQLNLARSEAIKRGANVTLCKSDNGVDCVRGSDWHQGWMVFTDHNGNRQVDADETVIQIKRPPENSMTLNFAGALNHDHYIAYKPGGQAEPNGTFTFCDGRGAAHARAVIVLGTGRPRVSTKTSQNQPLSC